MAALTPCPEHAEKEKNGADNLTDPPHSLKIIPGAPAVAKGLKSGVG
jgi:hypothetical protein